MNCQHVDSQLLVKLILLHKNLQQPLNFSKSLLDIRLTTINAHELSIEDDINRQVDVSFPISDRVQQIDMEIIEMTLKLENIIIEKKVNESENEYFRRITFQLKQLDGNTYLYY